MSTTPTVVSLSFRCLQQQTITWALTDQNGNSISGATLSATLYIGRSRTNPLVNPGIADSVFNKISMPESPSGSGTYVGTIPQTFNPPSTASWFVTVITAIQGASVLDDIEVPTVVVPPQNSTDLVLLDDVKSFLNIPLSNTNDDKTLQIIITGFSQYVLNLTGVQSFTSVNTYTEYYDGNGNTRLMLRNAPILSLVSVTIGSYSVPFSTSTVTAGVFIEDSKRSIGFRWTTGFLMAPQGIYPYAFTYGQGNIQVIYTAGYIAIPFDIYEACMRQIGILYRRKDWLDMASKSLAGGAGASGTTTYRNWQLDPEVRAVLMFYSRYAKT